MTIGGQAAPLIAVHEGVPMQSTPEQFADGNEQGHGGHHSDRLGCADDVAGFILRILLNAEWIRVVSVVWLFGCAHGARAGA